MLIATIALLVLAFVQAVLVIGFVRVLRRSPPVLVDDNAAPRAAVILCLRGMDPFLGACLGGLFDQDYPDYEVRIIVDHAEDAAHAAIAAAILPGDAEHVRVENLAAPRSTCSLKCSSLAQAVESLDDSVEFIAQLDADVIPHRTWLRELATAVMQPGVGAATGNRWYAPERPTVGSLVRYTWNAAAIVQMYWYEIAWGGTLAVRMSAIRDAGLVERWRHAFCEDTMLRAMLGKVGLRVAFVPELLMINRESCSLSSFYRWVTRQMTTARLYHPAWPAVVVHGVATTTALAAATALLIAAIARGDSATAWLGVVGLTVYAATLAALLPPMERAARRIAARRGEPIEAVSARKVMRWAAAAPITQLVHPIALAKACWMRSTDWRGIDYRIGGPWDIEMLEYRPYRVAEANGDSL